MSEGLRDFVIGVASDPDLAVRFAADPAAELDRAAGLTDEERSALLSRDSARLRELLGAARKGAANVAMKKKPTTKKKRPAKKKK